jgi:L-alanine-DL-glutamate epimerase-like enolase superfamily enzyme
VQLDWKIVYYQLKEPFRIAHGEYHERKALIIELSYANAKGFGECIEIDYYHIHLDEYLHVLSTLKKKWEDAHPKGVSPLHFFEELDMLGLPVFLQSALDCAYWDLYGKLNQTSILSILQLPQTVPILSSITISADTVEKQIRAIQTSEWSVFKVKVTHWSTTLRDALLQLEKPIAIDANGSFTPEQCIAIQEDPLCSQFTYFEQPMPKGSGYYHLLRNDQFANWMADEDVQNMGDLSALKNHYRSVNLKIMKCGGITPTLDMIKQAKSAGFKIMIGCMTESTIGISAGMSLAAYADFLDLDGANLITNDPARGWSIEKGNLLYSSAPGLGIRWM